MKTTKNFFEVMLEMQNYNYCRKHEKAAQLYEKYYNVIPDDEYLKNRFLSEYEISLGKTVLESKPQNIQFVLFNKCNSNCIMCNQKKDNYFFSEKYLISALSIYLPYLNDISWQGGEVFLWDKFIDMLKYISSYKTIMQTVITNAQLLNEELIKYLVSVSNIRLVISIDSLSKQKYEQIREGSSFCRLIESIKLINKYKKIYKSNISLNIDFVIIKENIADISNMPDFAKKYKFDSLTFNECILTDKYKVCFDDETKQEIDNALQFALVKALKNNIRITINRKAAKDINKNNFICKLPWTKIWFGGSYFFAPECVCLKKQKYTDSSYKSVSEMWNSQIMQDYRKYIFESDINSRICNSDCRLYYNKSIN